MITNMCSYLTINFSCFYAHLNGEYYTDPKGHGPEGIQWHFWLNNWDSLKSSTMMIKSKKI